MIGEASARISTLIATHHQPSTRRKDIRRVSSLRAYRCPAPGNVAGSPAGFGLNTTPRHATRHCYGPSKTARRPDKPAADPGNASDETLDTKRSMHPDHQGSTHAAPGNRNHTPRMQTTCPDAAATGSNPLAKIALAAAAPWHRYNRRNQSRGPVVAVLPRSEEHTSELQSLRHLVCRLLL